MKSISIIQLPSDNLVIEKSKKGKGWLCIMGKDFEVHTQASKFQAAYNAYHRVKHRAALKTITMAIALLSPIFLCGCIVCTADRVFPKATWRWTSEGKREIKSRAYRKAFEANYDHKTNP